MFILSKFKNRLSENKQKTQVNSYLTLISGCEIGIDDLNVAVENVEQSGHLHLQHEVKVGQRDPGSLLVPWGQQGSSQSEFEFGEAADHIGPAKEGAKDKQEN